MKSLLIFSSLFFYGSAVCQVDNAGLSLAILSDSIFIHDKKIDVEYTTTNTSKAPLIYYSLGSKIAHSLTGKLDRLCDTENTGAGILFLIFDETNRSKSGHRFISCDFSTPMTVSRFDSLMNVGRESAYKSTVILKGNESRRQHQEISLREFDLKKGRYYFQVVYFAGKKIPDFLGREQLDTDQTTHNANVFQGCAISNRVTLIVN